MRAATVLVMFMLASLASPARAADAWKNVTKGNGGLSGDEIQFIGADESGTIWIGTRSGLTSYSGGKFTVPLDKGEIWNVLRVGEGKYWVGAGHGAILRQGGKDELFLKGHTVAPVLRFGEKAVWAIKKHRGTEVNTVVENKGAGWEPIAKLKGVKVVDMFRASSGAVWVIEDGNGVYEMDPGKPLESAGHHLEGSNVTTFYEDSKKRLWFGLWEGGVLCYERGEWARHLKKEKSFIFGIREDGKGDIWVATNQNGLWRSSGEKWENDLREEGGVNLMERTSDGRIWISTQSMGGLRFWDGKKWQVSLDSPLPIRCLFDAKAEGLWAGGVLDGIHILKK